MGMLRYCWENYNDMNEKNLMKIFKYVLGVLVILVVTIITNDKFKEYQDNKEHQKFYKKMREHGISPITRGGCKSVQIDTVKIDSMKLIK
jgi:uncharacterized phage-associated protein